MRNHKKLAEIYSVAEQAAYEAKIQDLTGYDLAIEQMTIFQLWQMAAISERESARTRFHQLCQLQAESRRRKAAAS